MNRDTHDEAVGDDEEVGGLSGERTDLAWSRSGLALVVCLAAIAKRSLQHLSTLDARAVVVAALAVGGVAWAYSLFWARTVAGAPMTGRRLAAPRKLQLIAIGTAVLGVAAAAIALLPDR